MLHCYADESGMDAGSPMAVLGAIVIQRDRFFYLDVEWKRALERHSVESPIHMREFGPDKRFGHLEHSKKRALLADLVAIINEHKEASITSTIAAEPHRKHISPLVGPKELSLYGDCFLHLCIFLNKCARDGRYEGEIPIVMDEGNDHTRFVVEAHKVIREQFQPMHRLKAVGDLAFSSDTKLCVLQAADIVAWAERRRQSGNAFNNGSEPVERIFEGRHYHAHVEDSWLAEIAALGHDRLRARNAV